MGKALAARIEAMWAALVLEHRAWDLLAPVLAACRGERAARLGRLYNLWVETRYNPVPMRRLLADVDVEPLVASFDQWYHQHVRALFALLYSTGIEVGTALGLTRAEVWDATQEIRAAGTKAHTRDRVAAVTDWGWPIVRDYIRPLLTNSPLFPSFRADVVWHWHRDTTTALGLTAHLRVHAARHHWVLLALRAGVPVRLVQLQLGHATPTLTLGLYGASIVALRGTH